MKYDQEKSHLQTDVIRIHVLADNKQTATEKASQYAKEQGYQDSPNVIDAIENPYADGSWAVYLVGIE